MFDGKAFGQDVVGVVKTYMERTVAPLLTRIDALEKAIASMPIPKDGKDADVEEVAALAAASILPDIMEVRGMVEALQTMPDVPALVAEAIAAIPAPKDGEPGKSITVDDVAPLIADEVAKAVADIRVPEDGKPGADGKDADPEIVKALVAEAVAALPPAERGKDADPALVEELVIRHAERILAGWERPKDGVPGEKGSDGRDGEQGPAGRDGKDGLDAVEFLRDANGHLIVTMSNGKTRDLGEVNGKDGAPGAPGKDGIDGVGFADMDMVETDEGVFLRFTRGDVVKDWRLPVPRYCGIYSAGKSYYVGDSVTWGGSLWIAQEPTTDKPDSGKGWKLAVKRGADGKTPALKKGE
ncbi:hypothetical protein LB553_01130 [Mesorhizobium sp. CA8]|uniref:hypothetical protein n=1 Tax=Mesorhizobium sp. CA8 TaxID=2876637 RepID=UPI001CCDB15C|nr:hypothetical protein [Mesorhizobium sp. CA8]MBZ9759489.1 hypothetical protein [Mesorhizobium sp. CA8]